MTDEEIITALLDAIDRIVEQGCSREVEQAIQDAYNLAEHIRERRERMPA